MIKTTAMLLQELQSYRNPRDKLARMVQNKECIPIIQGLYETDSSTPGYRLANCICTPSYLSFEFALSFHGLIPEAVYNFTSATFEKKKKKFINSFWYIYLSGCSICCISLWYYLFHRAGVRNSDCKPGKGVV